MRSTIFRRLTNLRSCFRGFDISFRALIHFELCNDFFRTSKIKTRSLLFANPEMVPKQDRNSFAAKFYSARLRIVKTTIVIVKPKRVSSLNNYLPQHNNT